MPGPTAVGEAFLRRRILIQEENKGVGHSYICRKDMPRGGKSRSLEAEVCLSCPRDGTVEFVRNSEQGKRAEEAISENGAGSERTL